jgi:hypothetical protein
MLLHSHKNYRHKWCNCTIVWIFASHIFLALLLFRDMMTTTQCYYTTTKITSSKCAIVQKSGYLHCIYFMLCCYLEIWWQPHYVITQLQKLPAQLYNHLDICITYIFTCFAPIERYDNNHTMLLHHCKNYQHKWV